MGKAIGIDFGTTNTVVSYVDRKGRVAQISFENRYKVVPTALYYTTRDDYTYGVKALNKGTAYPGARVTEFKMHLLDRDHAFHVRPERDREFKQVARSAVHYYLNMIFNHTQEQLTKEFGPEGVIEKVVITVPAKFNDVARKDIREAAMKALATNSRDDVRLTLEPTAAAIAAMHDSGSDAPGALLVYDFGGGTFDISLIKKERGIYRQVVTDGEKRLGGKDLTHKLMKKLLEQANDEFGTEFPLDEREFDEDTHGIELHQYQQNMDTLKAAANTLKEELSTEEEVEVFADLYVSREENDQCTFCYTRAELEELLRPEIGRTVDLVCKVLADPRARGVGEVKKLVLAGGSSSIPLVRQLLHQRLPHIEIEGNANVSTLISRGAALLAQKIEEIDAVTEQSMAMAIGVSATEGMHYNKFEMIIPQGAALPCEGSKDFQLAADGQRSLDIRYYEHDAEKFPRAVSINDEGIEEVDAIHLDLPGGLRKSDTVITVTFHVNKDGSMDISAAVRDADGTVINSKKLTLERESDLA